MQHAKPFFEHTCHKCGLIDEARFVFSSNMAVKQICNGCGFYVKFFDKALVPTVFDIKQKIWYIVEANLGIIKEAKREVEFIDNLTGMPQRLMYWKLYLNIRNLCSATTKKPS